MSISENGTPVKQGFFWYSYMLCLLDQEWQQKRAYDRGSKTQ